MGVFLTSQWEQHQPKKNTSLNNNENTKLSTSTIVK